MIIYHRHREVLVSIDDCYYLFQVSVVGVLFLAGLYISSISSCMGGLYGSPRILQCIANENVIPIIKVLGKGVSRIRCVMSVMCVCVQCVCTVCVCVCVCV